MQMIEDQIIARGIKDPALIEVMRKIPRHEFVPEEQKEYAYEDHPLPIGEGQTISQPYVVALMTEILKLKGKEKVLEIGTGSGYQAAILSELAGEVYSVEISSTLAGQAKKIFEKLGIKKVNIKVDDGYEGWAENAPYNAIVVTCAPDHIPQSLVDQLAEGGKLVIPVGPAGSFQTLWLIEKIKGNLVHHNLGGVIFVPMRRK